MTAVLHVHLLGGVQIGLDTVPVSGFISNKVPALLAYLAVTRRSHQREALAALLWGEMPDADAKNNLRQALANLRKLLDDHLIITRDSVTFDTAVPHQLDTYQFEQKLQASRSQTENSRFALLQEAVTLYQGDFLAGFFVRDAPDFEEWMLAQRVRYRELALHALHTLTEHHLSRGEYGRAIDYATRLLALDAWREEAHRQLMLALARSGQRSAALAQYETCCQLLDQELGVPPSAETIALYERILAAGETPRHNLPPQPTQFVGRHEELATIQQLLLNPECRLLTLVGTGGMGKSRLSLEAAARAHAQGLFLHGVFFVPLVGVDSVTLLATAVADALGFSFAGSQEPTSQLLKHLQTQEMLLVLDNFDQLLAETAWVVRLLHQAPGIKLLLTSREALAVQWEWPLLIEGLSVPAIPTMTAAAQSEAIQLFFRRYQVVQPAFSLTNETLPPVFSICQMVGGMPLALELAAAAGRHFSCPEIAAAISQNLDFLTSRFRDTPPRQRSLRAVFDYSWQQLTAVEQLVFAKLGVFRGGFTAEAAAQISQAAPAALTLLLDKSLLQRQAGGRYQFHETVRQYALSRLEASDNGLVRRTCQCHADFYLDLAYRAEAGFHGEEQSDWLARLDDEQNNLRAALEWTQKSGRFEQFAKLCGSLWQYWYIRSRYQEGANWLALALPHLAELPPQNRSKILRAAGVFATQLGEYERAVTLLEQSLAIQRSHGTAKEIGLAANSVAVVLQAQGRLAEAVALYQESLALQRQIGDQVGMAQTLQNLGAAAIDLGDVKTAQEMSSESLALFRQLGLKWGIAYASINLALAMLRQGMLAEARHHIMEGLALCREIESVDSVAECLEVLAGIEQGGGRAALAVELLSAATRLREEVAAPRQAGSEADFQQLTAVLHQQLPHDQFAAHWASGHGRSLDQLLIAANG